ncbi:MAG: bifunctional phosphoribosylaminoimidazolecarboxamide formyltransferase/IMP cyclohydrolase, partial [Symbiobacteriaceae bacterium]|nr:bifunctional phosphoribosylaminoimidazolecarboxamide formyltransferase/IMP cyclohydrolase [Symbiobacteriaceae bacterium]
DANAALEILLEFTEPTVVAVKHANPCGVASAADIGTAFNLCYEADPVSIYGGIVAINRTIDAVCAEIIKPVYLDILMAPSFTPEALEILAGKSMIVLELGELPAKGSRSELQVRSIIGGLLLQERDTYPDDPATWSLQSQRAPSPKQLEDLLFAWKVVKHMRSNAIVVVKDKVTWGLGIGQVNRVDSTRIALQQAGGKSDGAVLASDGFFPFDDNISEAGKHGISCLVEPGGSIRDEECIATANSLDLVLLFTHIRHFKH